MYAQSYENGKWVLRDGTNVISAPASHCHRPYTLGDWLIYVQSHDENLLTIRNLTTGHATQWDNLGNPHSYVQPAWDGSRYLACCGILAEGKYSSAMSIWGFVFDTQTETPVLPKVPFTPSTNPSQYFHEVWMLSGGNAINCAVAWDAAQSKFVFSWTTTECAPNTRTAVTYSKWNCTIDPATGERGPQNQAMFDANNGVPSWL